MLAVRPCSRCGARIVTEPGGRCVVMTAHGLTICEQTPGRHTTKPRHETALIQPDPPQATPASAGPTAQNLLKHLYCAGRGQRKALTMALWLAKMERAEGSWRASNGSNHRPT